MSLPNGTEIKLLSIGMGLVVFSIEDNAATAASISELAVSPRPYKNRSSWIRKELPFHKNPLDDPDYWWLSEYDRQQYDIHMKTRHDIPNGPGRSNPLTGTSYGCWDVRTWLYHSCYRKNRPSDLWVMKWPSDSQQGELKGRYPWAFKDWTPPSEPYL